MASVTVRKEDNRESVSMRVGDVLHIVLPENASTGYRWRIDAIDRTILRESESTFKLESQAVGAGGIRTMSYQATGVGSCHIRFVLTRPWEEDRHRDEMDLAVVVSAE